MPEGEIPEEELAEEGGEEDEETTLQERMQEEMEGEGEEGGNNDRGESKSRNQQRAANTSSDPNAPQQQSTFGSFMGEAKGMLLGAIGGVAAGYAQDMAFGEATSMLSTDNASKIQEFQAALEDEDDGGFDEENNDYDGDENGRSQRGAPTGDNTRDAGAILNPDETSAVDQVDTNERKSGRFAFMVTVATAFSTVVKDNVLKTVADSVLGEEAADALFTGMEDFEEEEEDDDDNNNEKDEKEEDNKRSVVARDASQRTAPLTDACPPVPSGSGDGGMWADFGTK